MKKIISSCFIVAGIAAFAFNVYAIGCPSECRTEAGEPKNGYCVDADGPEGSEVCTSTGTGEKQCNGTWTPVCNVY